MDIELFMATRRIYQPGQILSFASAPHLATADATWLTMEAAFDGARPAGYPSRRTSRFACESPADCMAYYGAQTAEGTRRVYRVIMTDPVSAPMTLTGVGQHHVGSPVILDAIASEYWTKQLHEWEYLEYLSPRLKIVQEEPLTDNFDVGLSILSYQNDRTRARQLWPWK